MAPDVRIGPMAVIFRRLTAGLCVVFLIFICGTVGIAAETYPSRPIRLLIGFSPGGPADIPGRAIAERMSQSLGVPVVPENKPGAGGMLRCKS
jgi:tripartite-type tricarboxylate transporter receptor subunit TctC